jgi:hypothetical protein
MKRTSAIAMAAATILMAGAANAEWPPREEIQAPRGQEIQAPRGDQILMPRD